MSETRAPVTPGAPPAEGSSAPSRLRGTLSFLIPALVVAGIILVLVQIQAQTEAAAANVVNLLPIGRKFGHVNVVADRGDDLAETFFTFPQRFLTSFEFAVLMMNNIVRPLNDKEENAVQESQNKGNANNKVPLAALHLFY